MLLGSDQKNSSCFFRRPVTPCSPAWTAVEAAFLSGYNNRPPAFTHPRERSAGLAVESNQGRDALNRAQLRTTFWKIPPPAKTGPPGDVRQPRIRQRRCVVIANGDLRLMRRTPYGATLALNFNEAGQHPLSFGPGGLPPMLGLASTTINRDFDREGNSQKIGINSTTDWKVPRRIDDDRKSLRSSPGASPEGPPRERRSQGSNLKARYATPSPRAGPCCLVIVCLMRQQFHIIGHCHSLRGSRYGLRRGNTTSCFVIVGRRGELIEVCSNPHPQFRRRTRPGRCSESGNKGPLLSLCEQSPGPRLRRIWKRRFRPFAAQ